MKAKNVEVTEAKDIQVTEAKDTKVSKSKEVPEVIEEAVDPQIDDTSRKKCTFLYGNFVYKSTSMPIQKNWKIFKQCQVIVFGLSNLSTSKQAMF